MIELIALLYLAPIFCSIPIAIAWGMEKKPEYARNLPMLSVFGLFISLLVSLYILFRVDVPTYTIEWLPEYNINFVFIFDYLSKYMGVLTAFIAFLIGVYGLEYMKDDYRLGWYWMFFNVFTASMLLVVYSDNLLMLLIGWEGLGIASWGLIGHWFRDDDPLSYVGIIDRKVWKLNMFWSPSFGGWRAISTIRFGDMPMFFAVAAIYALTGNLNISEIDWAALFHHIGPAGTLILILCFLMGPFTKSAQLPFSEWLMTAMTGPTTVSALLHSATMVAAGTYLFMRFSWYVEPWHVHSLGLEYIYILVLFSGLLSALYGAIVATGCLERKVLLAASTMSSLGLMFASSAASMWLGKIALYVAFWYLIVHAFAKATLFLVAGHLIHVTHDRFCVGDKEVAKKMKLAFIVTIFATISLSGIPPFTAYWVKSAMDEVMHHLTHEFGALPLTLLILTSIAYAAFLAKFLSLNFIKGEKAHLHLHGGNVMGLAYSIMVSMLAVLLILIVGEYEPHAGEFLKEGFVANSFMVGVAVLASYSFALYVPRIKQLSSVGTFLSDRMYLPFLNDFILPKVGWFIAKIIDYCNKAIDFFCHKAIPSAFEGWSIGIRAIQSGELNKYIKIVVGCVILVLAIISVLGW
ncbi:NADH-quinone oxidoreductase subunit L [Archaeoglobales archaeon]|nr:MAG: NADH-quinone oxidoreductase subunit L [Archaeoglobales archaeon]